MRLIDADALWAALCRDEAIEDAYGSGVLEIVSDILDDMLGDAPTVDTAPVVRCSYCKFFEEEEDGGECGLTDIWMSDNDYCSLAERIGSHETD